MEKVKVMIVDDSKVSRAMLKGSLSKTNFEVVAMAKNAAEAVQMYEQFNPAVVTMDMNLPDADGIECSQRIHQIDPDAKIVMISAMKDASLVARGRDAGISAFLQKPVSMNDLIDTLMILCQNKAGKVAVLRESYAKPFLRALQQGLNSMIEGRTSFIIAHRLSTIRNCDRIFYIDGGGIAESGTHDELMAKKGFYYKLYTAQG